MIALFDGHCDTLYASYEAGTSLLKENPAGHLDIRRIDAHFAPSAQFFAIFYDSRGKTPAELAEIVQGQYAILKQETQEERLRFCTSAAQARSAQAEGKIAAFLSLEGAELMGCDLAGLEAAHAMGVRAINLTWNRANALSGTAAEEPERGLSPLGRQYVRRMQELGILVDVSHLSDPGFWDVIELAQCPIFASHSNARALCPHPRNLTDAQFQAIRENGGVAGLNLYAGFLGEGANFDTIRAHLEHFWGLGGEENLSLGGDLDGCDQLPRGFEDGVSGFARLYDYLLQKNYSETLLNKLYFKNLIRVVDQVCTM